MGKMIMAVIFVVIFELALYIFPGNVDVGNSSIFSFVLDPTASGFTGFSNTGSPNAFLNNVGILMLAFIAIAGISAGTGFVFKQDSVIFAGFALFLGGLLFEMVKIWTIVYSYMGIAQPANGIVATIATAPLLIAWVMILVDYIRGRD